jgi:lysophospholipase L1-like esterase
VVLYAGDNDIAAGKPARQVADDFEEFERRLGEALPETRVVYIAIKPSLARWQLAPTMQAANSLIRKTCESDERLTFVDVWTPMLGEDGRPRPELFKEDGLHLNAAGYQVWRQPLAGLLRPPTESPATGEAARRAG